MALLGSKRRTSHPAREQTRATEALGLLWRIRVARLDHAGRGR